MRREKVGNMHNTSFPYGREKISYSISEERLFGILEASLQEYIPSQSQEDLVQKSILNPIGTKRLSELSKGKQNIVLIASDHTRPVPSKIIIPQMLKEIRSGNPDADITILISTGCHRETTIEELEGKFGADIVRDEKIIVHDCDLHEMCFLGKLPSGGDLYLNKIACDADLLISEGFIEPHFFAGFSGGRKSVLPGVANRKTVLYNHNAEFINHPSARAGVIEGNPIHEDMIFAARKANLAFICNVVINSEKEVIYAASGDCEKAHKDGYEFLLGKCKADAIPADIVICTNGGYPLDQNIYQAVKGMSAAEATVKEGGVIIMLAKSDDGHGAPEFHKTFKEEKDLARMMDTFLETPKEETRIDQWQSQILARILMRAKVIYISDADDEIVKDLHMIPAHSLDEAMKLAEDFLHNPMATVTAIPDGVGVIVIAK